MKFHNFKKQRGAVLAFSLVMLLLLTLAGTRMIQQNKQQLAMANNMRISAQEFANAESILANAKTQILTACNATGTGFLMVQNGTTCTITVTVNGIKIDGAYDMSNNNKQKYWKEMIQ